MTEVTNFSIWEYVKDQQSKLDAAHEFAQEKLNFSGRKMKRLYDRKTTSDILELGVPVWLHYPIKKKGLFPELMSTWKGPYTVTKRINDVVYRIQLSWRHKLKVINRNR